MRGVQFPSMRAEVVSALRSLSDLEHQKVRWGLVEDGVNYFDDLSLVVHILYDDAAVLPDPSASVGSILYEGEVGAILDVEKALSPLLDELGDVVDSIYVSDSRWPAVLTAAANALEMMECEDNR